jgi:hypothetical protein
MALRNRPETTAATYSPYGRDQGLLFLLLLLFPFLLSVWNNKTQSAEAFQGNPLGLLVVG